MPAADRLDQKSGGCSLTRQDWCQAGLAALTADGEKGLTVSRIAKQLGVTYGSFYHHFRDSEDFHVAVLDHWHREILVPLARRNLAKQPASMEVLVQDVEGSGCSPVEIALRQWAQHYAPAAAAVRRADRYRMRVMAQMLRKRGVPPAEARSQGELMLLAYLGGLQHPDARSRASAMRKLVKMIDEMAAGFEVE